MQDILKYGKFELELNVLKKGERDLGYFLMCSVLQIWVLGKNKQLMKIRCFPRSCTTHVSLSFFLFNQFHL